MSQQNATLLVFQASSFIMILQKSNKSQRVTSLSQLYIVFNVAMKKLANMKEGTFVQCLSSFQLKIKRKRQRVRDKAYKVVNLTSMCASIISMDISTAWPKPHIHT